jgi:hypothetical protein
MYPHRIRLRGPWQCEVLKPAPEQANVRAESMIDSSSTVQTIKMPCFWREAGLADFTGRVRFRRRFGVPRKLDDFERVWLTLSGAKSGAEVSLNGRLLGLPERKINAVEIDVTQALQDRNELVIELEKTDETGGPWTDVGLEIRCAAFLRDVRLSATFEDENARVHLTGTVAGETDLPLEIYVILGRFTIAYQTVKAGNAPFQICSEELPPARWQVSEIGSGSFQDVRVELVQGSMPWYTWEQAFDFRSGAAGD